MIRPILLGAILCGLAGPLAAQPSPAPGGAEATDPQTEKQRNNAAKLAGMIRFVATSCQEAEPDYDRFKAAIAAMRVDIKDLESGPLMATSLGYSQAYQKEPEASCKRAFQLFGENGTAIPDLIARKAKTDKPAGDKPANSETR